MRKVLTMLFVLLLSGELLSQSDFSGGDGTKENPYQITTLEELQKIDWYNSYLEAHYILMNDIDASDTKNWNLGDHDDDVVTPDSCMGFLPIGGYRENKDCFNGGFNGDGHSILNLYINRPATHDVGLFARVHPEDATIKNINVINCNLRGSLGGGLVGRNWGYVINSSVTGIFIGGTVGGLVGVNFGYAVKSHTRINITGIMWVGGLVAKNYGIVGDSYATGNIKGLYDVGGLIGSNSGDGGILDSYAIVNVTGTSNVGGLVGHTDGVVAYSYAIGNVKGSSKVGGLAGMNENGTAITCFWNSETSNRVGISKSGQRKNSKEMKNINTYLIEKWDFKDTWSIEPNINNGYPHLKRNIPLVVK